MVTVKRKDHGAVFKAIADPTRREILGLLRQGSQPVGDIASNFKTSRPAISRHLRLLRSAGLVTTRKQGTVRMCQLNPKPLRTVKDWLHDYEILWDQALNNLKKFVEENP